jgi:hypothetical protein
LRRVVFFRPVDFRAVVFFVVLRPVALRAVVFFRPVVFFVVLRPVAFRAVVFLRPVDFLAVVFFVVFRPALLLEPRAVVFFRPVPLLVVFLRPPPLVPLEPAAACIGAAGGGVPGNGAGQLDAGSCCEPDQVSPRLPCSTKRPPT